MDYFWKTKRTDGFSLKAKQRTLKEKNSFLGKNENRSIKF
jgi:hypothetical protein